MRKLFLKLLINTAAVYFAAIIIPGVSIGSFKAAIFTAIIIGLVNIFIKPIVKFFSFPFIFLTLGLFLIIINAGLLYFVSFIAPNFAIYSFFSAILASIFISVFVSIGEWLFRLNKDDKKSRWESNF